jgi:3-oxoacyl-[acyl-carrier protein] reductase
VRAVITGGGAIGTACAFEIGALFSFLPSRSIGFDLTKRGDRLRAMDEMGNCDILINCVGGGGRFGTDEEVWQKNVVAMQEFTAWALPAMIEKGWGRVVTISSIHGREYGSRPIFMAAKAAQIAYMKGMSKDQRYVRRGITFNTVCPGNVLVDGKPRVDEDALPMGRMGKPQEVAKLVAFLCSNDAGWINGSTLVIDGGESNAF